MQGRRLGYLSARERTMKVSEVIDKAIRGELRWLDAAAIVGVSDRQMRRWRARFERDGVDGLRDRRQGRRPGNRIAEGVAAQVLDLYRTRYEGFNVRHFWEQLEELGVQVSYSWTKALLHEVGYVRRHPKRGTYRRRRDRKPMVGMMLHLDGSKHRWFQSPDGAMQDLLVLLDDASSEIVDGMFVPEESTLTVLALLKRVAQARGTFASLYTDRASHFVFTPKAGQGPDRSKKTQVQRVLDDLGIELICAFSPQARGRSERLWRTLQGRLPLELEKAGITTYEAANAYFETRFRGPFNRRFGVKPAESETAFVPIARADLDQIFTLRFNRVVGSDNTVRLHNRVLQLPKVGEAATLARRAVAVRVALDGTVTVLLGTRRLASFDGQPLDDGALEEAAA
jgi:transposase